MCIRLVGVVGHVVSVMLDWLASVLRGGGHLARAHCQRECKYDVRYWGYQFVKDLILTHPW